MEVLSEGRSFPEGNEWSLGQVGGVCAPRPIAFEALPVMAMIERRGVVVARNALLCRMTGYGAGDATNEFDRIEHALLCAYNLTSAERLRFDCLLLRKDGPPMQVNVVSQPWEVDGVACRLILMMERGDGFEKASQGEGSFLEDVLDATPEPTVIAHEGRILHVNREFTRVFGYSTSECVGQELDELVIPEGRVHESEVLLHLVRSDGRSSMETVRRTRSGEELAVSVLVSQVRLGGDALALFVTYRDIRKQKEQEARLQHTALHDGLTGLANRALFLDRMQLTLARLRRRPDRRFAAVFVDLDGFKRVNDTIGHAGGDALLQEVAARLLRCLRPQDTVARFGGDEFALLLDEIGTEAEAGLVAERIQAEIQRPIVLDGVAAKVSASMGIAVATAMDETGEQILVHADAAMYEAKAAGKGRHVIFRR